MHARYGFTRTELLAVIVCIAVVSCLMFPVAASVRKNSGLEFSMGNLAQLGIAHAVYAADWNDRQITFIAEDISAFGSDAPSAFQSYDSHPSIILGWGCHPTLGCGEWSFPLSGFSEPNFSFAQPIDFPPLATSLSDGGFRLHNARPLHDYLNGLFYDPAFYAPNDTAVWPSVQAAFDVGTEYVFDLPGFDPVPGFVPAWSSYDMSPAAMFHPDVMRGPAAGGWQDPWSIDHGFEAPGLHQALHPSLKTHMIEHHWNQDRPLDFCADFDFLTITYNGCAPYYFNHGAASKPATLFYDMSIRLLPNEEVIAADDRLVAQTGSGLWSRDTSFGASGYLGDYSADGTIVSHHLLTTEGILGRDTVANMPDMLTNRAPVVRSTSRNP